MLNQGRESHKSNPSLDTTVNKDTFADELCPITLSVDVVQVPELFTILKTIIGYKMAI